MIHMLVMLFVLFTYLYLLHFITGIHRRYRVNIKIVLNKHQNILHIVTFQSEMKYQKNFAPENGKD